MSFRGQPDDIAALVQRLEERVTSLERSDQFGGAVQFGPDSAISKGLLAVEQVQDAQNVQGQIPLAVATVGALTGRRVLIGATVSLQPFVVSGTGNPERQVDLEFLADLAPIYKYNVRLTDPGGTAVIQPETFSFATILDPTAGSVTFTLRATLVSGDTGFDSVNNVLDRHFLWVADIGTQAT